MTGTAAGDDSMSTIPSTWHPESKRFLINSKSLSFVGRGESGQKDVSRSMPLGYPMANGGQTNSARAKLSRIIARWFVAVKRTPLDAVITDLVRERSNWTCERCGEEHPYGVPTRSLHCSHFYGRKWSSTRYDPDNVYCLCASCHSELTDDHHEHVEFVRGKLGCTRYSALRGRWRQVMRRNKPEKDAMLAHYRDELERLRQLRMDGQQGTIDFVGWY